MSCVTCRYCVTPAAAATIGECPSTCDIAKAISAWEAALFTILLLINHPAPRHRVWNASIKWELCSIWLHLDIHHPLLRVARASFWETHWGSSPMSLSWCKEYLRKTQASASDASIHKSSLVLWSCVQPLIPRIQLSIFNMRKMDWWLIQLHFILWSG